MVTAREVSREVARSGLPSNTLDFWMRPIPPTKEIVRRADEELEWLKGQIARAASAGILDVVSGLPALSSRSWAEVEALASGRVRPNLLGPSYAR